MLHDHRSREASRTAGPLAADALAAPGVIDAVTAATRRAPFQAHQLRQQPRVVTGLQARNRVAALHAGRRTVQVRGVVAAAVARHRSAAERSVLRYLYQFWCARTK
jgi:hypothetical protein